MVIVHDCRDNSKDMGIKQTETKMDNSKGMETKLTETKINAWILSFSVPSGIQN